MSGNIKEQNTFKISTKNMRVLDNGVIVRVVGAETKTAGGIHLPDSEQKKPHRGVVVFVGEGMEVDGKQQSVKVCVGDSVLYKQWSGTEIPSDLFNDEGSKYVHVKDSEILVVGCPSRL